MLWIFVKFGKPIEDDREKLVMEKLVQEFEINESMMNDENL